MQDYDNTFNISIYKSLFDSYFRNNIDDRYAVIALYVVDKDDLIKKSIDIVRFEVCTIVNNEPDEFFFYEKTLVECKNIIRSEKLKRIINNYDG